MDEIERAKSFSERVKTWASITGGEERETKLRKTHYYLRFLLDDVVKRVQTAATNLEVSGIDHLILPVGTSIEPLCIVYQCVRPKRVYLLHTPQTADMADIFVAHFGLKASQFQTAEIDSEKPVMFYEKIRDIRGEIPPGGTLLIDITGGKKSMVAASAAAGFTIGARVTYVDNRKYLQGSRIPEPGAEFLLEIENPAIILGDIQMREIATLFNNLQFSAAERICSAVRTKVSNPLALDTLIEACKGYEAWQNFQFRDALNHLRSFQKMSKQYKKLIGFSHRLSGNIKVLEFICGVGDEVTLFQSLIQNRETPLGNHTLEAARQVLFSFFARGCDECECRGNHDTASLLFYRAWEMYQQILFAHRFGVQTREMPYEKLGLPMEELERRYSEVESALFSGSIARRTLPPNVSLLAGAALLHVAGVGGLFAKLDQLRELKDFSEKRNSSKYAHGFSSVTQEAAEGMKGFVKRLFFSYPLKAKPTFDEEIDRHRFQKLVEDDLHQ